LSMKSAGGGSTASKSAPVAPVARRTRFRRRTRLCPQLGAALNPIRAQGRCSRGQSDHARRARGVSFSRRWHHTIRLGVEGGGRLVLDAQLLAQGVPDGQGELCAPVSRSAAPALRIWRSKAIRMSAQVAAAMSRMGSVSSQREDLSTTVNRCRWQGAYDVIIKPMYFVRHYYHEHNQITVSILSPFTGLRGREHCSRGKPVFRKRKLSVRSGVES
jgi:hypothetical protein